MREAECEKRANAGVAIRDRRTTAWNECEMAAKAAKCSRNYSTSPPLFRSLFRAIFGVVDRPTVVARIYQRTMADGSSQHRSSPLSIARF